MKFGERNVPPINNPDEPIRLQQEELNQERNRSSITPGVRLKWKPIIGPIKIPVLQIGVGWTIKLGKKKKRKGFSRTPGANEKILYDSTKK